MVITTPRPSASRDSAGTPRVGGQLDRRAGLECADNHVRTDFRSTDRPARSQSLYLLSCALKLIWFIQMLRVDE